MAESNTTTTNVVFTNNTSKDLYPKQQYFWSRTLLTAPARIPPGSNLVAKHQGSSKGALKFATVYIDTEEETPTTRKFVTAFNITSPKMAETKCVVLRNNTSKGLYLKDNTFGRGHPYLPPPLDFPQAQIHSENTKPLLKVLLSSQPSTLILRRNSQPPVNSCPLSTSLTPRNLGLTVASCQQTTH